MEDRLPAGRDVYEPLEDEGEPLRLDTSFASSSGGGDRRGGGLGEGCQEGGGGGRVGRLAVGRGVDAVSYTHLTLPTTPYV